MAVFMTRLVQPVSAGGGAETVTISLDSGQMEAIYFDLGTNEIKISSQVPSSFQVPKNSMILIGVQAGNINVNGIAKRFGMIQVANISGFSSRANSFDIYSVTGDCSFSHSR